MNSAFIVRGVSAGCRREGGAFVIMAGQRGPQGRPGTDAGGGIQTIVRSAGQDTSALRIVYERFGKVYPVDPSTRSVFQALGLTLTGSSEDAEITIQTQGYVDDQAWSWTEGIVWCGPNGVLTQVPPTTGWDFVVGFATSPTRLYIDLNVPVLLA